MSSPLGYFISWTTKGSWLHGDARGFVIDGIPGIQEPDPEIYEVMRQSVNGESVVLNPTQRAIVMRTIEEHCRIRGWTLHAVNPRTNHVHVVVTANGVAPETVMEQFKAWCSRRLNEHCKQVDAAWRLHGRRSDQTRRKWWTEHGSTRWINSHESLEAAIVYVRDMQDLKHASQ